MKCVVVPDSEKAAKVGEGKGREGKGRKAKRSEAKRSEAKRGRKRDGAVGGAGGGGGRGGFGSTWGAKHFTQDGLAHVEGSHENPRTDTLHQRNGPMAGGDNLTKGFGYERFLHHVRRKCEAP